MEQKNNSTPPIPPLLKELNELVEAMLLKRKKSAEKARKKAENYLSDGRNPLTLKDKTN